MASVKLEALLIADAAQANPQSGLLDVGGAAWRYIEPAEFPSGLTGSICGVVSLDSDDFGAMHTLASEVSDDDGHVDVAIGSFQYDCREPSEEMSSPRLPFAIAFQTVVRAPTLLTARLTVDAEPLGEIAVVVRAPTSDA